MKLLILWSLTFVGVMCVHGEDVASLEKKLDDVISIVIASPVTIENAKPDGFLTKQMVEVDRIGQKVMSMEHTEEVLKIQEKALALLSALRERRAFRYMAWAECRLEMSEQSPYDRLENVSEDNRVKFYNLLTDVNVELISENILSREIMNRQAAIYDTLSAENKKQVRRIGIAKQVGPLPNGLDIKGRKTLDEF